MNSSIATNFSLPDKYGSSGFLKYLNQVNSFPILSQEEEFNYSIKYSEQNDMESAKMLLQSHLRLVVKIALKFKNYGLPVVDLVSEGNLGLVQAVKKFEPRKGFRFSTYAMWWIRAFIQDYILRSWSLVKIGTTLAQKKLFFNLHKIKKKLGVDNSGNMLSEEKISKIASNLNVSNKEVIEMDSRLSQSDTSLNNLIDSDSEDCEEVGNLIASSQENQEEIIIKKQQFEQRKIVFDKAFSLLNEREKDILIKRQLTDNPSTLEELSKFYNISRERIRQIEENAINKIKKEVNLQFSYR